MLRFPLPCCHCVEFVARRGAPISAWQRCHVFDAMGRPRPTNAQWKGMFMKRLAGISALFLALILAFALTLANFVPSAQIHAASSKTHATISHSVKNDVSPPLRSIPGKPWTGNHGQADDFPQLAAVHPGKPNNLKAPVQASVGTLAAPATSSNFDGVGNGFTGPQGTYTVAAAPPDTNGTVGPHDYVQTVNTDFAIFNKDASRGTVGTVRYGPVAINTLWSGFGGLCQTDNDGDPT